MTGEDHGLTPAELAEAARPAIEEAGGKPTRDAARVVAEAGLTGVCVPEDDGGMGLDLSFALAIAEEAGRLQLRFPLIDQMLLARALGGTDIGARIASGEGVAVAAWGAASGGSLRVMSDPGSDWVLFPTHSGAELVERGGLAATQDSALDPDDPEVWLEWGTAAAATTLNAGQMARLTAEAQVLYGGFVTGAAARALDLTAGYMATRVQFGRPLSSKQAVRHHLARMKLLLEISRAALARSIAQDESGNPRDVRPAFTGAVRNAAWSVEKAIHLHGGMGFTWEVPLHVSLRDVRKIEAAFRAGRLAREVARDFIEAA